MIKFFRKIRQQLLSDNKFSKYILYAFGEIVLVMVGILLALQINNNNEAKKDRAFEIKMLKEVRKELVKDTIYFNMISKRAKRSRDGAAMLIDLIIEENTNLDSVSKAIYNMSSGFQYMYHKGAYEAIKSVGIDKISNDSIRFNLTDLYDFSLPRTKELLIKNKISNQTSVVDRRFQLLNIVGTKNDEGKITVKTTVKKSMLTDPNAVKMAVNIRVMNDDAILRLKQIIDKCSNLLQKIESELKIDD